MSRLTAIRLIPQLRYRALGPGMAFGLLAMVPIATKVEGKAAFYPADAYHQNYMARHPRNPYIVANDAPKLRQLQRLFPERMISKPVLVEQPSS